MANPNPDRNDADEAASPDALITDLDVQLSSAEESGVVGGKAGKGQQEYIIIKMNDVIITSVTHGSSGADGGSA